MFALAAGISGLFSLIIVVVLVLALIWVLYWAINRLAPEPIRNILSVLVVVFGALVLIYYAAQFFGLV
jgi:hypothetical protein